MNDDDLKKIAKLIKDEVRPVKELVEITKQKVDQQEMMLISATNNVRTIKDQQSVMNEKLDNHTESLETLHASVVNIENTIKVYADMYKKNNSDSKKLERRVEVLENKNSVIPPSEFTLTDL